MSKYDDPAIVALVRKGYSLGQADAIVNGNAAVDLGVEPAGAPSASGAPVGHRLSMLPGRYSTIPEVYSLASSANSLQQLVATPIVPAQSKTLDYLAFVTANGGAGITSRIQLVTDNNGIPSATAVGAEMSIATPSGGLWELAPNIPLTKNQRYWLLFVQQGGAGGATVVSANAATPGLSSDIKLTQSQMTNYVSTGLLGGTAVPGAILATAQANWRPNGGSFQPVPLFQYHCS